MAQNAPHKGTATFIAQRASAALLLPLTVWFVYGAVKNAGASYEAMRAFIASPLNAAMMALLILAGAVHMRIGLNEIIDDYFDSGARGLLKLLNLFACLGAALVGLFALYRLVA